MTDTENTDRRPVRQPATNCDEACGRVGTTLMTSRDRPQDLTEHLVCDECATQYGEDIWRFYPV